jgi:hypothetical protein
MKKEDFLRKVAISIACLAAMSSVFIACEEIEEQIENALTSVTLSQTSLTLEVSGSATLTAVVVPSDKTVTWKSSDDAVASVSSTGTVTGKSVGKATVTAATSDGAKSATCEVTVTQSNVAVTGVTISSATLSLSVGDNTTLTTTVEPASATNKAVTWSSSNEAVATVDASGVVTAVAAGTADITVTTADGSKKATCKVTVTNSNTGNGDVVFTDSRGNKITIPDGASSCVIRVISFEAGSPWTSDAAYKDPEKVIGVPDAPNDEANKSLTMGAAGVLVVEMGTYFTDSEGLDIYVFEVGPNVEATKVEVSTDLQNWIYVGDAKGAISGVDINGKVPAGAKYKYIRLTDLKTAPNGSYPGAEIDAIAVFHPATNTVNCEGLTEGKVYTDSRGNKLTIPGGALSCASQLISFEQGNPWTTDPLANDPVKILGEPDYDSAKDANYLTLGSGGVIVLGFDIYITDEEGLDIYVFEIGPNVEATKVEVSDDLKNWIYVGDANGALSGVDIHGKVPTGGKYRYVRLTDLKTASGSSWPGADIDAVAVMHPVCSQ